VRSHKYTGVLRAWNLEVFRNRLKKAGMLDQDIDFHKASGAWAAICYKAEMEEQQYAHPVSQDSVVRLAGLSGTGNSTCRDSWMHLWKVKMLYRGRNG
jgi:hypothetical protein